jgi:uncharacterized protein YuzE
MKVTYDQEVDILNIELTDGKIEESDEDKPGVILDYDAAGNIVSIEILNASKRIRNPRPVKVAQDFDTSHIEYVSAEEQADIVASLNAMSEEDKRIGMTHTVYVDDSTPLD